MAQEMSEKTLEPLKDKNQVRPYDNIWIKWPAGTFHKVPYFEKVHRLFGEKMIAEGKAEASSEKEATEKAPAKSEKKEKAVNDK